MIFIMFTRLIGKEVHPSNHSLKELKDKVTNEIAKACPQVKWISNYALLGEKDYLDIFTAPDLENAMKVGKIVRHMGHASTEIFPAIEWKRFEELMVKLPDEKR